MLSILSDLLLAALMLFAIYGVGLAVRSPLKLTLWSSSADAAFTFGFGVGVCAIALFILAVLNLFIPFVAWGVLLLGLLLLAFNYRLLLRDLAALRGFLGRLGQMPLFVKAMLLLAVVFVGLNLLGDIALPTEGDTVHQYLLLPRYWVEAGSYVQPTHIWAATLPGNAMLLAGWALLLKPSFSLVTLLVGFGASLMVAVALYALGRLFFLAEVALIAVMLLYTMPDAGYLAQSGKVDMLWALFEILALAAFLNWFRQANNSKVLHWLAIAGLFAGLAAGTKIQAFISILLLTLWLVVFSLVRGQWGLLIRRVSVFLTMTVASGFPFYLYNLIIHRSPFYPVFADQFALIGGTASPRSELGTEVFYAWTPLGYIQNLIGMSIGHAPALNFYLGFIVGPVFLMVIVAGLIIGVYKQQRILVHMLTYAFFFSVIWFVVKQAARHFVPGLALLAIAAGFALSQFEQRKSLPFRVVQIVTVLMVGINLVLIAGVLYGNGTHLIALGVSREAYIARWHNQVAPSTFPTWETVEHLDAYTGERILAEHANSSLYITPDIVSGNWGDRIDYANIDDPDLLSSLLADNSIGYVLVTSNVAGDKPLFARQAFLDVHGELVYEGERMSLYQLDERQ